ncbi:hypothetical protein [Rubritalea tangerina]|uniref:ABC transmembrane type-1 domain-containing protein n=1 Tax=Rubritalea tangerina TaxID=430798 RepID=A0ABW4ZCS6_9BACT
MSSKEEWLIRLIGLIGKGARMSVVPIAVLVIGCSTIMLMSVVYFRWAMELSWWWALAPMYLLVIPLGGMVFYWFTLDGLSRLPESLVESKETWRVLKDRVSERKQGVEIRGFGPVATMRRMLLLGGMLWDSRDAIDTASNLYSLLDLFNPIFWVIMLVSLLASVAFSMLFVAVTAGHYFFF